MKNKDLSACMPLFFTVVGFAGIGYLMIYRILRLENELEQVLGGLTCILYLSWVIWEMRISIDELHKEEAKLDRHTMEICAIVKISLLIALFAGGGTFSIRLAIIGIVIMMAGVFTRGFAIKKLGRVYSHRIREVGDNIVTVGPYKIIRHPAYLGTLIAHTGITIVFLNHFSLVALSLWYLAVFMRVIVEDNWLLKEPKYRIFAARVRWRFIPYVW